MTVDWMLDNMTSDEITRWQVYFKIENENESDRKIRRQMLEGLMGKRKRGIGHRG